LWLVNLLHKHHLFSMFFHLFLKQQPMEVHTKQLQNII
jgi:hypothetical protein